MTTGNALNELRIRRSTLATANADNASPRLIALLDWLCDEPDTKAIVEKLIDAIDESKVFQSDRRCRVVASTPEEIAFAGYALMTNCRQYSLWRWCSKYNIRGPYKSSNYNEMTRAALEEYIEPFLDHLEKELIASQSDPSLTVLLESRLSAIVEQRISAKLPNVAAATSRIAAEFSRPGPEGHWQNVGNSCREVLKIAIREMVERKGLSLPPDVQLGNVKRVAELLVGEIATSDSRGTTIKLIGAVWDHAQTVTHRDATTKDEAARLFVWTSLALYELLLLC